MTPKTAGTITALEGIVMDVTERMQARKLLEHRVAERTRELSTLLDVSASVASTKGLDRSRRRPLVRNILSTRSRISAAPKATFVNS